MFNFEELKAESPKATALLVEWVKQSLQRFQDVMTSQLPIGENVTIPEITNEHAEKATGALLTSYYRTLFDFLDQNKIFLTTDYIFEEGFVVAFSGYKTVEGHMTRIEAEIAGIKAAFKHLEEQL